LPVRLPPATPATITLLLLCYFNSEGGPVVQKKSKPSCLGREGHGTALLFSFISSNTLEKWLDHFNTMTGFLEYLETEKLLCEVIKIRNIIDTDESEFNFI